MAIKESLGLFLVMRVVLQATLSYDIANPDSISFYSGTLNSVRNVGIIQLVNDGENYTITIGNARTDPQVAALIVANQLANITVDPQTVTQSIAKVDKNGQLSANFTVSGIPNPQSPGGYQIYLQILPVQVNLLLPSTSYFMYQTNIAYPAQPILLYFNILSGSNPVDAWYSQQNSVFLSDSWTTNMFLTVPNSFGTRTKTSKTWTISMPSVYLDNLPVGTYQFRLTMAMNPYTTPNLATQVSTYTSAVQQQANFFSFQLGQFTALLSSPGSLSAYSSSQIAQIEINQTMLIKLYIAFLKGALTQYAKYAADATITKAVLASITPVVSAINAQIVVLQAML